MELARPRGVIDRVIIDRVMDGVQRLSERRSSAVALGQVAPAYFNDMARQVDAQVTVLVVDGQGLLRRASLNHLGSVISIDAQHHRRPGIEGPFLTVSTEGVTESDPPLCNPSVKTSRGLIIIKGSEIVDGYPVETVIKITRGSIHTDRKRRV